MPVLCADLPEQPKPPPRTPPPPTPLSKWVDCFRQVCLCCVQIYLNNTAPIWWPHQQWDSQQIHRKADCQKVSSGGCVNTADSALWSDTCQTHVRHMSDTCQTHIRHMLMGTLVDDCSVFASPAVVLSVQLHTPWHMFFLPPDMPYWFVLQTVAHAWSPALFWHAFLFQTHVLCFMHPCSRC